MTVFKKFRGLPRSMRLLAAVALCLSAPNVAAAEAGYAGKRITLYVGYGAGGGYDLHARLLAEYFGQHIPGNPAIVVQNVPGAGSMRLSNQMAHVRKGDATAIALVAQTTAVAQALGYEGVKYDAREFEWIGRIASGVEVSFVWRESPVKTIADAMETECIVGGTGPTSASVMFPKLMNAVLGTKFRVISGYKSAAAIIVAMERGELHGGLHGWSALKSQHAAALADKSIQVLVQHSLSRHPELPNVPTTPELARTPQDRKVLELFVSSSAIGFSIFAPPGVDSAHRDLLRRAFDATMADPIFVAEAKKRDIDLAPATGEAVAGFVQQAFDTPTAVLDRAKALYRSFAAR